MIKIKSAVIQDRSVCWMLQVMELVLAKAEQLLALSMRTICMAVNVLFGNFLTFMVLFLFVQIWWYLMIQITMFIATF